MVNFFTFTFTLPSKHRKEHNIFQTILPNNIRIPKNSLTNFQVSKKTITTFSLSPLTKQLLKETLTHGYQSLEGVKKENFLTLISVTEADKREYNISYVMKTRPALGTTL